MKGGEKLATIISGVDVKASNGAAPASKIGGGEEGVMQEGRS